VGLQSQDRGARGVGEGLASDTESARAIGAVVARFVHTEEVTGSNPVSPTNITAGQRRFPVTRDRRKP
jgi:hypothetical protein